MSKQNKSTAGKDVNIKLLILSEFKERNICYFIIMKVDGYKAKLKYFCVDAQWKYFDPV